MNIRENEPLSKHTTFRTGGRVRFFVEVETVAELADVIARAKAENVPYIILGEGSNVLINDADYVGYVVRPLIKGIEFVEEGSNGECVVVAGAGEHWDDLVAVSVLKNLSGMENMSLIPGSVGAAPVQNIGAYGTELKDILEWVEIFNPARGEVKKMSRAECGFGYRESFFKTSVGRTCVITRVAMRLSKNAAPNISYKDLKNFFAESVTPPTVSQVREAVISIRKAKLPDVEVVGTAGSFFKNPIVSAEAYTKLSEKFPGIPSFSAEEKGEGFKKIPLAWILDKVCGLNGFQEGNVGLYKTQPLALVNFGGATTAEIKNFAKKISDIVREKTGIEIEWEVNLIA